MIHDWKKLTGLMALRHGERGGAILLLDGENVDGGVLVDTSPSSMLLQTQGTQLLAKRVRGFLWDLRFHRCLKRDGACLWSLYVEEEGVSLVGIGAIVSSKVSERYIERDPERVSAILES